MPNPDFDERAATWDDEPERRERAHEVARRILATRQLASSSRVLDYGAGTGLLSEGLAGHVGTLILADPSAGMREVARQKVAAGILPDAEVLDLDLTRDPVPDLEVDAIVTMMALHHIPDLTPVLAAFAALLPAGGALVIVDLEEEDGSFHDEDFDGHHGFNRTTLTAALTEAGFGAPSFEHGFRVPKEDRTYDLFLAIAKRLAD
jgi:ubiquinone/menaquinone biosynthesis C-methylase UbiE